MSEEESYQEEIITEGAEYSPKSEFSKPRICEKAVTLCIEARGREMKAGYFNTKIDKNGDPQKSWIEDARKVYIGKVEALRNILSPELQHTGKEKIKEAIGDQLILKQEMFDIYSYQEKTKYKKDNGRMAWKEGKRKFIPEIDSFVIVQDPDNPDSAIEGRGYWNIYTNAYWDEMINIYDEIFSQLNILIDKLNYFKSAITF